MVKFWGIVKLDTTKQENKYQVEHLPRTFVVIFFACPKDI